jgi:hypothetical protein
MSDMDRLFFSIGALSAGLGVALGAFGAHALKARLTPDLLAVWETGVRYQIYHAFGLMAVAWAASRWPGGAVLASGWAMVAGTVLFLGQPGRHPHHRHRSRHQPLARARTRHRRGGAGARDQRAG